MGEELVRETTRNEEFDAEQLESFAELLQQLEEIAGEKMPSVADLLVLAADAAGAAQAPDDSAPEDSAPVGAKPGNPPVGESDGGAPAPPGGLADEKPKPEKYGPEATKPLERLDDDPTDPNQSTGTRQRRPKWTSGGKAGVPSGESDSPRHRYRVRIRETGTRRTLRPRSRVASVYR